MATPVIPNEYTRGQQAKLTGTYKDASGNAADPTTATVRVRKPDGSTSAATPTHDGLGAYSYIVTLDMAGVWAYRFEGTGAVATAGERTLIVLRSAFGNGS